MHTFTDWQSIEIIKGYVKYSTWASILLVTSFVIPMTTIFKGWMYSFKLCTFVRKIGDKNTRLKFP